MDTTSNPGAQTNLLEMAWRNSDQLARLIDDIIDIEKLESGMMILNLKTLDMSQLVREAIELNTGYANENDITIEALELPTGTMIQADEVKLKQVMANLLSNAAKFSPAGGTISAFVTHDGHTATVSVSNDGAGIPDDIRSTIFDKFVRGENVDSRNTLAQVWD